jgi:hypothetical protein
MTGLFRTTVVEISGVRTISGGGTNASNAGQALLNLSGVSITGDQTIGGVKTFSSGTAVGLASSATPSSLNAARGLQFPNIGGNGDGVIYGAYNGYNKIGIGISPTAGPISDIIEFNPTQILGRVPILASNLVYNTGNQTISGVKTFATGIVARKITISGADITAGGQVPSTLIQGGAFLGKSDGTTGVLTNVSSSWGAAAFEFAGVNSNVTAYNNLSFTAGNFPQLWLGTNGRVGLGTSSPAEKVHISGGNLRVDGGASFSTLPTVNGTGVLLSGSTPFVINFGHVRNNTSTGSQYYYFGPQMDIDPVSLANNEKRRVQILQDCFLRKIVWTTIAKTNAPIPSSAMTGYFKNFATNASTRDDVPGIQVTSGINIPASNTMYTNSTGNLNIPITGGNYVSFYYQTNFNSGASNLASGLAVNVAAYFYV